MCSAIALVGDMGTDHNGFPPTPITGGSPNVLLDHKPVARQGDPLQSHSKPKHGTHGRQIAAGCSSVLVNGQPVAITGGAVSCGGVIIGSGSAKVG